MKKNVVKVNETQLRQIVSESVKEVLKENQYQDFRNDFYKKCEEAFAVRMAELDGNNLSRRDIGFIKEGMRIVQSVGLDFLDKIMSGFKLNEISQGLVRNARDAAFDDMKQNWNNSKIRTKREGQWKNFSNAAINMERDEKNSVCPEVPASELYNMPPETCVVMDGAGRDGYSNFIYRYSGHAGTKEQCEEFVNKFYDNGADWEFMPEIFTLEEYIRYKKQHPYC